MKRQPERSPTTGTSITEILSYLSAITITMKIPENLINNGLWPIGALASWQLKQRAIKLWIFHWQREAWHLHYPEFDCSQVAWSFPRLIHKAEMNRKAIIIGTLIVVVLVIVIAVPCALLLGKKDEDETPKAKSYKERAEQILDETPLVDG